MNGKWTVTLMSVMAGVASILAPTGVGRADGRAAPDTAAFIVIRNIAFANPGGTTLKLDLFKPDGATAAPCVIVIHGGGFFAGDKAEMGWAGQALALNGYLAVSVNYRLNTQYPGPVDDIRAAIAWMKANAASYGGDPSTIALFGASAGGILAQLVAFQGGDVDAIVSWSGATDFQELAALGNVDTAVMAFAGTLTDQTRLAEVSPITYAENDLIPVYLANSAREKIPVDGPLREANLLSDSNVAVTVQVVPGDIHSAYPNWALGPSEAFLRAALTN